MKPIDRRAVEFRNLQAVIISQITEMDPDGLGTLAASLSFQEFRSLEFLDSAAPCKTKELAEHLHLAVNSVTAIVDGLEHKRLVRRQKNDTDRRIIHLTLTEAGQHAASVIVAGRLAVYRGCLAALTDAEQETLLALYRKIVRGDWVLSRFRAQGIKMPTNTVGVREGPKIPVSTR